MQPIRGHLEIVVSLGIIKIVLQSWVGSESGLCTDISPCLLQYLSDIIRKDVQVGYPAILQRHLVVLLCRAGFGCGAGISLTLWYDQIACAQILASDAITH